MTRPFSRTLTPWLGVLLAIQLAGFCHTVWFFVTQGYLPAPFIYDKADTFMDFYHPLFWAGDEGRYTVWRSVYPPLNFLILKIIGFFAFGFANFADGFAIRSAYPGLQIVIAAISLASALAAFRLSPLRQLPSITQTLLFFFFVLSPPFLFAIERGNLIVLALPLLGVSLAHARWRMAAFALLINLKPYFLILLLVYIAQRRIDHLILTSLLAILIFLVTGLLLDANFLTFFVNLLGFAQNESIFSGREVLALPSSISAFSYIAELSLRTGAESRLLGYSATLLLSHLAIVNLLILSVSIVLILARGHYFSVPILISFFTLVICNLGVWIGGYSINFVVLLIPVLACLRFRVSYVAILLFLLSPLDLIVLRDDPIGIQQVYLSGETVEIISSIGIGSLIRPILDLSVLCLLVMELVLMPRSRGTISFLKPRHATPFAPNGLVQLQLMWRQK